MKKLRKKFMDWMDNGGWFPFLFISFWLIAWIGIAVTLWAGR